MPLRSFGLCQSVQGSTDIFIDVLTEVLVKSLHSTVILVSLDILQLMCRLTVRSFSMKPCQYGVMLEQSARRGITWS